jgi:hypothetical protein
VQRPGFGDQHDRRKNEWTPTCRSLRGLIVVIGDLAIVIALCLLGPSASGLSRVHVKLVLDGLAQAPQLEGAAMEEVTRIWAPYGVDVQESTPGSGGPDGAIRLTVALADVADGHTTTALGSIRFLGDVPEPAIVMYLTAIEKLVSTATFSGRGYREWPTRLRHFIEGRVMGRALAHEIGHFLLRSRHHSAAGLMRPLLAAPDLVAVDRRGFMLSANDAARLVDVIPCDGMTAVPAHTD